MAPKSDDLKQLALDYHTGKPAGKLGVHPTKSVNTAEDLALAYSPGVAHASSAIHETAGTAYDLTGKGNLVGVISDGTAVLGLGNIGPLAAKPVMEGKAVLFKKLAGVNAFDLELTPDADALAWADCVRRMAPTFGGINLEDIKAPNCFVIEEALQDIGIPVFHDDQHGTAIVVTAAILRGLEVAGKSLKNCKVVVSGAGAGALASLKLLGHYGLNPQNTFVFDSKGLMHKGRNNLSTYKAPFALHDEDAFLKQALKGADIFLGLSKGGLLNPEDIKDMAPQPLILALANPEPEIRPEKVSAVRDDALVATGRSDYPNQVNNVLCFPFLFRGALDVRATAITLNMKKACVQALSQHTATCQAQSRTTLLLPPPLDPDLITVIAPAVAQAAIQDGVAQKPLSDWQAYTEQLKALKASLQSL